MNGKHLIWLVILLWLLGCQGCSNNQSKSLKKDKPNCEDTSAILSHLLLEDHYRDTLAYGILFNFKINDLNLKVHCDEQRDRKIIFELNNQCFEYPLLENDDVGLGHGNHMVSDGDVHFYIFERYAECGSSMHIFQITDSEVVFRQKQLTCYDSYGPNYEKPKFRYCANQSAESILIEFSKDAKSTIELSKKKRLKKTVNSFDIAQNSINIKNLVPKINNLPFDFQNYFEACFDQNTTECSENYTIYHTSENLELENHYLIDQNSTNFLFLPKMGKFQPIIIAFTDSDVNGCILQVTSENKIVSSMEIAQMDGETIKDFLISKEFIVTTYTRKIHSDQLEKLKSYKINNDGKIQVIDNK